jgi:dihydrofolate synthase/folylpolyglutamate synthase
MAPVILSLKNMDFENIHIITAFAKDKEWKKLLALYPKNAYYYFCQFEGQRALEKEILCEEGKKQGLILQEANNVNEALEKAKNKAKNKDLILVLGSNFLIAEIENL